jgi:hypothetical protein
MVLMATLALWKIPQVPVWLLESLEVLLCSLTVLAVFLGVQQGFNLCPFSWHLG